MSGLPTAVAQAIEWYARQGSGTFDGPSQAQFEQWLKADPSHQDAWQTLTRQLGRTLTPLVRQQGSRQALNAVNHSRRRLLRGALAVGAVAVGTPLLTLRGGPLHGRWGADLHTATAERRRFTLEDGSSLLLNAQSAVDLDFNPHQRTVQLLRGAALAQVHNDPTRPFVLQCPWGEAWLDGGRCMLSVQAGKAQLWALEGELEVRAPGTRQRVSAGQGLSFDGHAWQPIARGYIDERAWAHGLLEVHDQPLGQVIEHLRPYHPGLLQISTRAAALRISGVFSLDDSRQALAALKDVLPLQVVSYLGIWTRIDQV
ncbi:FecR domain-containing protein [Pseudomonas syringae]